MDNNISKNTVEEESILIQNIDPILKRIQNDLHIILPKPFDGAANYVPIKQVGNLLYISGHLPFINVTTMNVITGRIGEFSLLTGRIGEFTTTTTTIDNNNNNNKVLLDVDYGYNAAKHCCYNILSSLNKYLNGNLSLITNIVKVFGIVQSTETFHEQHKIINGCSDLLIAIFGPTIGQHSRSAIDTISLPFNATVEIEMIIEISSSSS